MKPSGISGWNALKQLQFPSCDMVRCMVCGAFFCFALIWTTQVRAVEQISADSNPILDHAREQARINQMWADIEKSRLSLVETAMELARQDKELAQAERNSIQHRIKRLEMNQVTREWALHYLQLDRKRLDHDQVGTAKSLARWKRVKEAYRQKYTQLPERAMGEIKSGRAMNFLLDNCSNTAINLQMYLAQSAEDIQRSELQIQEYLELLTKNTSLPEELRDQIQTIRLESIPTLVRQLLNDTRLPHELKTSLSELQATLLAARQKEELMLSIGGLRSIEPKHLRGLRFSRGTAKSSRLVVTLSGDVLPLNWPYLLVRDEKYSNALETLSNAKAAALEELYKDGHLSTETTSQLSETADWLYRTFQKDKLKLLREDRGAAFNSMVFRTVNFVKTVRSGVAYLATTSSAEAVTDFDYSKPISPAELLAYISDNGLRFTKCETQNEGTYHFVYNRLLDFYANLEGLDDVVNAGKVREDGLLARLHSEEGDLREIQYRDAAQSLAHPLAASRSSSLSAQMVTQSQIQELFEKSEAFEQAVHHVMSGTKTTPVKSP